MVYITGDTHGDFSRFKSPDARKLRRGDTMIVLGDFGFLWNGSKEEQHILNKLSRLKYTVLFLDGPHENYDLLGEIPVTEWNGGKVQMIKENVMHLLRGEVYTIEYDKYFVFGGGEGPEHDIRTQTKTWWEEEMPSGEEMLHGRSRLAEQGNKVNFILSHEYPGKTASHLSKNRRTNGVNAYLGLIETEVEYDRWFFGSLHLDKIMSKRLLSVFQFIIPVHKPQPKRGKAKNSTTLG
ncbi:MAG: metallophosphoesterase [Oscillospiraceae bacterium]|nr:metallophosphoesterase [Oscillospiraceae bacterium]MDD4545821.1 metallophosphoesterase [Oscillospiraceae bacterium]